VEVGANVPIQLESCMEMCSPKIRGHVRHVREMSLLAIWLPFRCHFVGLLTIIDQFNQPKDKGRDGLNSGESRTMAELKWANASLASFA